MQVGGRQLTLLAPFCGVIDGKTIPMGQIELAVTFGGWDNFHTESITFDVVHFDLPYNAILAKFMAAVHYSYKTLKVPGPSGVITIRADVKGAVHCAERLFEVVVAMSPGDGECPESTAHPPDKQHIAPDAAALTKTVRLGDGLCALGMTPRRW
jgi:hypothetical protein